MSPDEINAKRPGNPSWRCVTCSVQSGLHWWNGLSVAVCVKPECSKAFSDMCKRQQDEQRAYEDYIREKYGDPV